MRSHTKSRSYFGVTFFCEKHPSHLFGVTYQFQVQETSARNNPGQIVNLEKCYSKFGLNISEITWSHMSSHIFLGS